MSSKFYYIDSEGNKKKYIGNVIRNSNGTYSGVLTSSTRDYKNVELSYHPAIEKVAGYSSYYTYMNNDGEEIRYYSFHKTDADGNEYFTYTTSKEVNVIYHPAIAESVSEYYTYNINGEDYLYTGKVDYNKVNNCYIGKLNK